MNKRDNIYLIGPMGAGKTTIGRQLAKKLSKKFYDSDHEIEERTGVDIPLIFEIEMESGFRKRESKILEELTQLKNIVLSTGGGAVLDEQNRKNLKDNGMVIYLKSSANKLLKRTSGDKRRPLLQGENKLEKIKYILNEREPIYMDLADKIIETDKMSIAKILQQIITNVNEDENS